MDSRVAGVHSRSVGAQAVVNSDSVTRWIDGVKTGDNADIQRLWNRYFERLVRLAGAKLPGHCRRAFDEEDIALSAFQSFCDRAGRDQFPQLCDRNDLWRVLATLTVRKAIMSIRHQSRQKRGGGNVLGESVFLGKKPPHVNGLVDFFRREPAPDEVASFFELYDHLFSRLEDPTLRRIALRKLEGYTSAEIASELGITSRTIDRKLQLIRTVWEQETPE
jgi:DNA-directed RNA polymerase specialized sigma24 family protein